MRFKARRRGRLSWVKSAREFKPRYEAYLEEGNDPGGIDVGFLVDRARVEVLQVTQEGRADSFRNPVNGRSELLNDRPPLVLLPASLALVASVP